MTDFHADVSDVKRLLIREGWDTVKLSDVDIEAFIDDANLIVDEQLGSTMSERRLQKIEARLAGHFILASGIDELRQADQIMTSDNAMKMFAGQHGEGLRSTTLGQQAIEFDTTGRLADIAGTENDIPFEFEVM